MTLEVLPDASVLDQPDMVFSHSVLPSDMGLGARIVADVKYVLRGEFRFRSSLAVYGGSHDLQVVRVHTISLAAQVIGLHSIRNRRTSGTLPHFTVRSATFADSAIATRVKSALPHPAWRQISAVFCMIANRVLCLALRVMSPQVLTWLTTHPPVSAASSVRDQRALPTSTCAQRRRSVARRGPYLPDRSCAVMPGAKSPRHSSHVAIWSRVSRDACLQTASTMAEAERDQTTNLVAHKTFYHAAIYAAIPKATN